MIRFLIFILIIHLPSLKVSAQDPVWNLGQHNLLYLNPAFASNPDKNASFSFNSRNQWLNLPGPNQYSGSHKFNQFSFISSISNPWSNGRNTGIGLGLKINTSELGEGKLGYNSISGNFGVYKYLGKISAYFGIGSSIGQYTLSWNNLIFSSQLDPYLGLVNPTGIVNPQNLASSFGGSVQFGGFLQGNMRRKNINWKIGGAVFHNGPEVVSFFDQNETIKRRYSIHGSLKYFPKSRSGLFRDWRTNYIVIQQSIQLQYPLQTSETRILVANNGGLIFNSIGIRSKYFLAFGARLDSWIYSLQVNTAFGMISAGYEYTISNLSNSRSGGTLELGMTIPLRFSLGPKAFSKREACYVEDLLKSSEWKALYKFSKASTKWGVNYSPIIYIP